ncbi:uncharacterized protein LOC118434664 [Folsomia candida]|uniref:uncharacterized protein LOC118434664 n=1 Tax=Folsomia candida TaxID=158441 RepID=UPI001604B75E|nr:uncharacterized protein LOC118434664 [Folsomia candida]
MTYLESCALKFNQGFNNYRSNQQSILNDNMNTYTSEATSSDYTDEIELDVDNFEIKLKLGGVVSTFKDDGVWRHKFPKKDPDLQKLSDCRAKLVKLVEENEKLRLKFDILFDLAKSTSADYDDTKEELKQLRKMWKQTKKSKLN